MGVEEKIRNEFPLKIGDVQGLQVNLPEGKWNHH